MSPSSTPSFSAMFWASSGCERPAKTISRFWGPRSSQCPGAGCTCSVTDSSPGRRANSVVATGSTLVDPTFLGRLLGGKARERSCRDVVRDDRSRPKPNIVPNRDRSNERIVDTGPDVPPDRGAPLRATGLVGVVRSHVSGGDVRVLADVRVADVRQVGHLGARPDPRLLDLHERARLRPRLENGSRAKVTERPDRRTFAD